MDELKVQDIQDRLHGVLDDFQLIAQNIQNEITRMDRCSIEIKGLIITLNNFKNKGI